MLIAIVRISHGLVSTTLIHSWFGPDDRHVVSCGVRLPHWSSQS
jgi:hypothetical protein